MRIYEENGVTFLEMLWPNNFHVHWREIEQLMYTLLHSARQFGYVMGMPNTKEPLTNMSRVNAYYCAIESVIQTSYFKPYVALYLTDDTTEDDIREAKESGIVLVIKWYSKGTTTNSGSGVTNIIKVWHILAYMEEHDVPLSVHGEVTDPRVGLYDRERVFVDTTLSDIHEAFPRLRIILEHVSTKEGVQFVQSTPANVVTTITPHHMLCNCNDVYMRPSGNCYPVINSPADQEAIIAFAISGDPKCFLGTDSAPHPDYLKFCDGGYGGCFVEKNATELFMEAFERAGALNMIEGPASFNGSDFHGLSRNTEKVLFMREPHKIVDRVQIGPGPDMWCTPFMAGETLQWQLLA